MTVRLCVVQEGHISISRSGPTRTHLQIRVQPLHRALRLIAFDTISAAMACRTKYCRGAAPEVRYQQYAKQQELGTKLWHILYIIMMYLSEILPATTGLLKERF